jgi:hypothetical protein
MGRERTSWAAVSRHTAKHMVGVTRVLVVLLAVLCWTATGTRGNSQETGGSQAVASGQQQEPSQQTGAPQAADEAKTEDPERPLPDIAALMHAVEGNQRTSEAIEKNYLFRSVETEQEMDSHGGVKNTETREYEVFWLKGVPVHRLIKKDGKEVSADELKKEDEKIDKEAAKANQKRAKADEKGEETDPRGNQVITVSRLLELGSFTNARRVKLNGRDTIAVDFAGDPKAKTRNRAEDVIRDLVGTAWIDETDRVLAKGQGHFVNSFKIGGGLVANIQKGTSFSFEQRKVNNEIWLPAEIEGRGAARVLLVFHFNGSLRAVQSDYRRFKATSTILPGMSTVAPETSPK